MTRVLYRPATEDDVGGIKALTDIMLAHTGLGVATVPKIRALVTSSKTLVLLALIDNKIVGYTCAVLHESIFNDVVRATDIGVFVLPEYRRLDIAKNLIERLELWAKDRGAQQLWLGQTTGDRVEVVAEYYRKLGYKIRGFNAVKEI